MFDRNAKQYSKFEYERTLPAIDLANAINHENVHSDDFRIWETIYYHAIAVSSKHYRMVQRNGTPSVSGAVIGKRRRGIFKRCF